MHDQTKMALHTFTLNFDFMDNFLFGHSLGEIRGQNKTAGNNIFAPGGVDV